MEKIMPSNLCVNVGRLAEKREAAKDRWPGMHGAQGHEARLGDVARVLELGLVEMANID